MSVPGEHHPMAAASPSSACWGEVRALSAEVCFLVFVSGVVPVVWPFCQHGVSHSWGGKRSKQAREKGLQQERRLPRSLVLPESPGGNGYCATGILWHSTVMASIAAAPIAILLCSERPRRFYFIMKDRPEQSGLSAWVFQGCLRAAAAFRPGAG